MISSGIGWSSFLSVSRVWRVLWCLLLLVLAGLSSAQTIIVGSKKFTESYVLGEIAKKVLTDAGFSVEHRKGMGATGIVWTALKEGGITMYPEYTGTISEEILKQSGIDRATMEKELAKDGIGMGPDLGFNDAYGLVMTRQKAAKLGITKISDLRGHPDPTAGITPELPRRVGAADRQVRLEAEGRAGDRPFAGLRGAVCGASGR